jgi:hypothetical protein
MGSAITAPATPHSQPQNITDRHIGTGLSDRRLPTKNG